MLLPLLLILFTPIFSLSTGRITREADTPRTEKNSENENQKEDLDALTPTVNVDSIDFSGITVSWKVNETSTRPRCTFEIELCHAPKGCSKMFPGTPWEQRTAVVPCVPLEWHNITVITRCEGEQGESTFPSKTMNVFTAFAPSRILNITVVPDRTSLEIALHPSEDESQYFAGYTIRLTAKPPERYFDEKDSTEKIVVFENLTPATEYSIIYAAFTQSENGAKVDGLFNEVFTKTLDPPPSKVIDLRHEMINASTIRILWGRPSAAEGVVAGYRLTIRDVEELKEVSHDLNATQLSYDFSSSEEYALFQFTVAAFATSPRDHSKRFMGENQTISVRTRGKHPPPPAKIRSEKVSPHHVRLSWEASNFESDVELSTYRIRCSNQMQVCFETAFSKNASLELRNLQASSSYAVDISACTDDERCGTAVPHSFSTPPGKPSVPRSLKAFRTEHSMLITWQPPEHLEGFLNGYVLGFCLLNEEDCPLNDEWEHVERTKTSVARPGHDQVSKVVLKAYNTEGTKSHYSDAATADVENGKRTSRPPTLFIIACIVMTGVVFLGLYLQYKKRRIAKRDRTLLVTANMSEGNAEIQMS